MILKINDRYINLDNVASISPVSESFAGKSGILEIEFVGRNSEDWGSTWVEGDEAVALRAWLNQNSEDVGAPPPPSLSKRIDRAVGQQHQLVLRFPFRFPSAPGGHQVLM